MSIALFRWSAFSIVAALAFGTAVSAQPTCVSTSQSPDSTVTPVDLGTVITLTLVSSSDTVSATIDGVPMSSVGTDTWEATHTAVQDTVLTAEIADAGGMTAQCTWTIDVNCIDPMITQVADPGESGIEISGTNECEYTVRITEDMGSMNDYSVLVGPSGGVGLLDVLVPFDALIEVGQLGLPVVTDSVMTPSAPAPPITEVPTASTLGLAIFSLLLVGFAYRALHRQ